MAFRPVTFFWYKRTCVKINKSKTIKTKGAGLVWVVGVFWKRLERLLHGFTKQLVVLTQTVGIYSIHETSE